MSIFSYFWRIRKELKPASEASVDHIIRTTAEEKNVTISQINKRTRLLYEICIIPIVNLK